MAGRKLKILVAGGVDTKDEKALSRPAGDVCQFAEELAREVIRQGHGLLNGCRTDIDAAVAAAAHKELVLAKASAEEVRRRLVCYVNQGMRPVHNFGAVMESELVDWELGGPGLTAPEIIHYADVVIILGGFRGTYRAANWARIERKPILALSLFGGAAKEICLEEAKRVDATYGGGVTKQDYEAVLKSLSNDWPTLAAQTVNLAERMATSREVFVIMSFAESPQYKDLYVAVTKACSQFGYIAQRVDESNDHKRIIPEIIRGVRQAAFVVADVTEDKANVYWELGLATGMDKHLIMVARKGTKLPFDVNDVPVLFWESFSEFETALAKRIERIASHQGRA
ncbi:MAG: hypothetical protein ABI633_08535 [Burkholderiales bacterium]